MQRISLNNGSFIVGAEASALWVNDEALQAWASQFTDISTEAPLVDIFESEPAMEWTYISGNTWPGDARRAYGSAPMSLSFSSFREAMIDGMKKFIIPIHVGGVLGRVVIDAAQSISGSLSLAEDAIREVATLFGLAEEDLDTRLVRAALLDGTAIFIRNTPNTEAVEPVAATVIDSARHYLRALPDSNPRPAAALSSGNQTPRLRLIQDNGTRGDDGGPSVEEALISSVRSAIESPHDRDVQIEHLITLITKWAGRFGLVSWNTDAFRQNKALMQIPPPLINTIVIETEEIWPGGLMLLEELGLLPDELQKPIADTRNRDGPVKDMADGNFKQHAIDQIDGILDSFRVFYEGHNEGAKPLDTQNTLLTKRLLNMPSTLVDALRRVAYFQFDKLAKFLGVDL